MILKPILHVLVPKYIGTIISLADRGAGHFPFTKNIGNFLLGISVWEKRVLTSPILRRPGRLRVLERHGAGDKTGNL